MFDAYQQSDLVTYPTQLEGFGNALLEAVYCRKPVVTTAYRILRTDIQPKGFKFIEFDEYFGGEFLDKVRQVLLDPTLAEEMVQHNFEIARRHYSYKNLENRLVALLEQLGDG